MKTCTQCKARFTGNAARCPLDGATLVELPDPLLGRTIGGRYRIESKIGSGGMAAVYKASHDLLGRMVAIKFLSPELSFDGTQRERFLREARATNRIKHEHIIDISDYGEEAGLVYLVMELLEGEPLANVVARGRLPVREAVDYIIQTARALARAHELEVIHRDLKPENIFLVPRGGRNHVKLLDFGLAHVRNEVRLTALGAVFGTPEYMSPEQARGAPVGPASDLYALGVVLYELLAGDLPFDGSTAELIVKHLKAQPKRVASVVPGVPPELDAIVAKLLAKDPLQRHRDAHHLIEDLQLVLAALPPEPTRRVVGAASPAAFDDPFADSLTDVSPQPDMIDAAREAAKPTVVPSSVRSWIERRQVFRRAVEAAYPRGAAMPDWVARGVERVEQLVDRAQALEDETQRVARMLAAREDEASGARGRIGRALDELARDESALERQIEDLERRIERTRARAAQFAAEFQRAWLDAIAQVGDGVLRSVDTANVVEGAARRAVAWRQSVLEADEAEAQRESRRAAKDDLRFQVAQLKGRHGALNAEVELELSDLRERASELGAELATTQEQLADAAAALAGHLGEFPAAQALLSRVPPHPPAVGPG